MGGLGRLPKALFRAFAGVFTLERHLVTSTLTYRVPAAERSDAAAENVAVEHGDEGAEHLIRCSEVSPAVVPEVKNPLHLIDRNRQPSFPGEYTTTRRITGTRQANSGSSWRGLALANGTLREQLRASKPVIRWMQV